MPSNKQSRLVTIAEPAIVISLLLFLFLSPIFIYQGYDYIQWNLVKQAWLAMLPFFILFVLNHFVGIPLFLFKNQKLNYAIASFLMIASITLYSYTTSAPPANDRFRGGPPPQEGRSDDFRPNGRNQMPPGRGPMNARPFMLPPYINAMLLSLLILGFDSGLRATFRWTKTEHQKINLEKENVKNRLSILRNQVSPHFFMNTLNNVHALIDLDTEQAKEAVIKLSKMMRHLLHEPESGKVSLSKEVNFLKSYVDLMALRFTDNVEVIMDISNDLPDKNIPPLLFTSLIENAFKHGVSYKFPSYIHISLLAKEDQLRFEIKNSKHQQKSEPSTGIGIKNTQDRLDLLYGSKHAMQIEESPESFKVTLSIPL